MPEVWFYHLTESTLEKALPPLLEKSLERGWRAVVQAGSDERIEALDNTLWTFREESFLAHSPLRDGTEKDQPVFLTLDDDNPNGASVRFLVDGAEPGDLDQYQRVVYLFDGHDEAALAQARERWKAEKAAKRAVTYWQQNDSGGWEKKA